MLAIILHFVNQCVLQRRPTCIEMMDIILRLAMKSRSMAADVPAAPRAWAGLAVVAAAAFVVSLDTMVLYVAFGDIRRDFPDVAAASLSWILSGYTIVIAAGMIGAGRWADRLGRRRVFLAGMTLFTVASAICAAAPGVGLLVAGRVLQGVGAAALTPASLALILQAFPKSRVPQAIALWGAAGGLAAALEIGRASCRGRGEISVVGVSLKKKKKERNRMRGGESKPE